MGVCRSCCGGSDTASVHNSADAVFAGPFEATHSPNTANRIFRTANLNIFEEKLNELNV